MHSPSSFVQVVNQELQTWGTLHKRVQKIPGQLILTGKWKSIDELPGPVGRNVHKTLSLNPDLNVRWLSDSACRDYLTKYFDQELVSIFANERRGSFRGDICRSAVLSREGGFYTDLDVEWLVPMQDLVDESTTFMSAYGQGSDEMLNAVIAAEPGSEIMKATLQELRNWYKLSSAQQAQQCLAVRYCWMGPVTLFKAVQDVQQKSCSKVDLNAHTLEKNCGPHKFRLYEQRQLHCSQDFLRAKREGTVLSEKECPPSRAKSQFEGLQFGLFEPGSNGKLVGWPRFAECTSWGCGGEGWSLSKAK